jgi:hypothetical protein
MEQQQSTPSPMRILEILKDRFGALEAAAYSSISSPATHRRTSCRWICSSHSRCWSSAAACATRWMMPASGPGRAGWDPSGDGARQPQEKPAAAAMLAQRPNSRLSGSSRGAEHRSLSQNPDRTRKLPTFLSPAAPPCPAVWTPQQFRLITELLANMFTRGKAESVRERAHAATLARSDPTRTPARSAQGSRVAPPPPQSQ